MQRSWGRKELGMFKEQRRPVGGRVEWREVGDVAGTDLYLASRRKSRSRKLLVINIHITQRRIAPKDILGCPRIRNLLFS